MTRARVQAKGIHRDSPTVRPRDLVEPVVYIKQRNSRHGCFVVIVVFVKRTCTHLGLRGLPYINSAVSPRSRPWKVGWKEGRVYFQVLIQEEYLSSVPHSVLA